MFKKWIKKLIKETLSALLVDLVRLEPESQYLLAVQDDKTALELKKALDDVLDKPKSPRIVILAARDFKVLEIGKTDRQ